MLKQRATEITSTETETNNDDRTVTASNALLKMHTKDPNRTIFSKIYPANTRFSQYHVKNHHQILAGRDEYQIDYSYGDMLADLTLLIPPPLFTTDTLKTSLEIFYNDELLLSLTLAELVSLTRFYNNSSGIRGNIILIQQLIFNDNFIPLGRLKLKFGNAVNLIMTYRCFNLTESESKRFSQISGEMYINYWHKFSEADYDQTNRMSVIDIIGVTNDSKHDFLSLLLKKPQNESETETLTLLPILNSNNLFYYSTRASELRSLSLTVSDFSGYLAPGKLNIVLMFGLYQQTFNGNIFIRSLNILRRERGEAIGFHGLFKPEGKELQLKSIKQCLSDNTKINSNDTVNNIVVEKSYVFQDPKTLVTVRYEGKWWSQTPTCKNNPMPVPTDDCPGPHTELLQSLMENCNNHKRLSCFGNFTCLFTGKTIGNNIYQFTQGENNYQFDDTLLHYHQKYGVKLTSEFVNAAKLFINPMN